MIFILEQKWEVLKLDMAIKEVMIINIHLEDFLKTIKNMEEDI